MLENKIEELEHAIYNRESLLEVAKIINEYIGKGIIYYNLELEKNEIKNTIPIHKIAVNIGMDFWLVFHIRRVIIISTENLNVTQTIEYRILDINGSYTENQLKNLLLLSLVRQKLTIMLSFF